MREKNMYIFLYLEIHITFFPMYTYKYNFSCMVSYTY